MQINKALNKQSSIRLLPALGLALALQALSSGAAAQGPGVLIQSQGEVITAADLEAELSKAPPAQRSALYEQPDTLQKIAANLLMRRVLAREAEKAGAEKAPDVAASLRLARDRILSDAQLKTIDTLNTPKPEALEKRIEDVYRAEAKRFEVPEEVHVRHILILRSDDAKDKADAILKELKAGADFETLAKEKSQDPGSGSKGGDLGFFTRGRMTKPFEEASFAMKTPGEISDVVESEFGFHILQFVERKEAHIKPLSEVRDEIKANVLNKVYVDARNAAGQKIIDKSQSDPEAIKLFIDAQKK